MTVRGLDVSNHQGAIAWPAVRAAGYTFAFVKATEGTSFVDRWHARNVAGARAAGLVVGSYHYAKPGSSDPLTQARHFASQLGSMGAGRLPAVLDLEETGGLGPAELRVWQQRFSAELDKLSGRTSILYTGAYFLHDSLGVGPSGAVGRPLWLAKYGPQPTREAWTFWQHSDRGTVPGIGGGVDLNVYAGTLAQLAQLAGMRTKPTQPPAVPAPRPPSVHPTPAPATPQAPAQPVERRTVSKLVQVPNTTPAYITDGITRRWVQSQAELDELRALGLVGPEHPAAISREALGALVLVGADCADDPAAPAVHAFAALVEAPAENLENTEPAEAPAEDGPAPVEGAGTVEHDPAPVAG